MTCRLNIGSGSAANSTIARGDSTGLEPQSLAHADPRVQWSQVGARKLEWNQETWVVLCSCTGLLQAAAYSAGERLPTSLVADQATLEES